MSSQVREGFKGGVGRVDDVIMAKDEAIWASGREPVVEQGLVHNLTVKAMKADFSEKLQFSRDFHHNTGEGESILVCGGEISEDWSSNSRSNPGKHMLRPETDIKVW